MLSFTMLKHLAGLAKKKLKCLALVQFFNNIPGLRIPADYENCSGA